MKTSVNNISKQAHSQMCSSWLCPALLQIWGKKGQDLNSRLKYNMIQSTYEKVKTCMGLGNMDKIKYQDVFTFRPLYQ